MKIGIIREGKNPPDKRVPFAPKHAKMLQNLGAEVFVQKSPIRAFTDDEYAKEGLPVVDDLQHCDVIMGVKEVPIDMLIPNKTFFFFSHTYKEQPYNRDLLRAILDKKIRLVDYEMLTNQRGNRLVAFGRYAGVVGAYNALRGWGMLQKSFNIKAAHMCHDREEMDGQLKNIALEKNLKIVLTGKGRVAKGAVETLEKAGVKCVEPQAFLSETFDGPVYTDLDVLEYNKHKTKSSFEKQEFYKHPERFNSNFMRFAEVADVYIACHYWDANAPFIFSREDAKSDQFNIKLVADVSCDIDGPVASTLRPSTIAEPFYGYCPKKESETEFGAEGTIGVMAVDNLPCELPRDASVDFGHDLIETVIPSLLGDDADEIIWRASETTLNGELTPHFAYLQDFVDGK